MKANPQVPSWQRTPEQLSDPNALLPRTSRSQGEEERHSGPKVRQTAAAREDWEDRYGASKTNVPALFEVTGMNWRKRHFFEVLPHNGAATRANHDSKQRILHSKCEILQ